jgi:cyclopropane fatty-acyl-phospholipid synthase-like methyltransferase
MPPQVTTSAAAERNKQPILEQLHRWLPADATVLEIASGTGQHVVHFAQALPHSSWQPSDPDPEQVLCAATRCDASGLRNMHPPLQLDVHQSEWRLPDEFDAVLCINMIHIAPWSATPALFAGARRILREDGPRLLLLYGAYREGGAHTSPSNAEFDASLRSRDSAWGVRDLEAVTQVAAEHGFARRELVRMPANNLLLVFKG